MLAQVHRKLGLVNAEVAGWEEQVREHIEHGTNFFLMLPKDAEAVKSFCRLFELPEDCTPKTLTQGDFFLLSRFVDPEAFDSVLHHWDERHQLIFVEQLDFPINRPPRLKDYIVYSPVLGILAQFERLSRAKEVLAEFQESTSPETSQPSAAVYIWEKERWQLFEGR